MPSSDRTSSIYEELGVKTLINATGTLTRLSGSLMPPEVVRAMAGASKHFVAMEELQARASEIIAGITGAEAGYVTSGAAAGLTLGAAACVTGLDVDKMNRLPDTKSMRNEAIIARSHRNGYDHAIRAAGIRFVEIGRPDPELADIERAISGRTAAIAYVAGFPGPSLPEVTALAHRYDVPVLVDAAAQLPPADNLRRFIREGADLVAFSGGKALRGPQSSGILCGRWDLIAAAALQHLDMDVSFRTWTPPRNLIDKRLLKAFPEQGIGRGMKVGKEEIVGLLTALQLYVAKDHDAELADQEAKARDIAERLSGLPGVTTSLIPASESPRGRPHASVTLDESALGMTAYDVIDRLKRGDPAIHVSEHQAGVGTLVINPFNLVEGDEDRIVRRMREVLSE